MLSILRLRKIIEIQNIVLEEKDNGRSQTWIYDNIIKERFFIAKSTFDKYMTINAKRLLKQQLCEKIDKETGKHPHQGMGLSNEQHRSSELGPTEKNAQPVD